MPKRHLTASYRPQTFAQVVGQDQIKKILSTSAAEEKIAPAYLFSGTRGVGKTTLARILAKALNCVHYPSPEPCNDCEFCRQITRGAALDVAEIDGASHTGVDHIRKLNEEIGYAPLECRYKVIIIDEAHMLSKSAFNALLKTLEEPPRHALFILATTEPHKFPQTIVSRCQHYTFKRVPQKEMKDYLSSILAREGIDFEPQALNIIIRKGGGSVRDCLSALSQILALGQDRLETPEVRDILGVAGQQVLQDLVQAFSHQDCLRIVEISRQLLDSGLDIGFFLQDLSRFWRNLFLLRQTGEQAFAFLELPQEECTELQKTAQNLSLSRIHASWQLTLEGQRRVLTSNDPGLALELLLLNLAFLPNLLPLEQLQTPVNPAPAPGSDTTDQAGPRPEQHASEMQNKAPKTGSKNASSAEPPPASEEKDSVPEPGPVANDSNSPQTSRDWPGFLAFFKARRNGTSLPNLNVCSGDLQGNNLEISCPPFLGNLLQSPAKKQLLKQLAAEYFKADITIRLKSEQHPKIRKPAEVKQTILEHPTVQTMLSDFQARIIEVGADSQSDPEQQER